MVGGYRTGLLQRASLGSGTEEGPGLPASPQGRGSCRGPGLGCSVLWGHAVDGVKLRMYCLWSPQARPQLLGLSPPRGQNHALSRPLYVGVRGSFISPGGTDCGVSASPPAPLLAAPEDRTGRGAGVTAHLLRGSGASSSFPPRGSQARAALTQVSQHRA